MTNLKCDNCKVKKCEARDVIIKYKDIEPELTEIIERNCNEYEPKED